MTNEYVIAIYIRLSVEDGDVGQGSKNESNSVGNQRAMLHDYIRQHDDLLGATVMELCDDGYSGTNFERPAVKRLFSLAKEGKINCIIIKDFSRFGREHIGVSDYVDQIFPFLGIRVISVNDSYDSEKNFGMAGGFDINLRNVINSFYSADISEKVRSGKRNKALRGDFLSAFAPIGYCKDKKNKNKLLVDENSANIVRQIFELAASGMSVLKITALLNAEKTATASQLQNEKGFYHKWWEGLGGEKLWDTSKVCSILRDERYLGTAVFGKRIRQEIGKYSTIVVDKDDWIMVSDCHEPIVSEKLFYAAQSTLKEFAQIGSRGINATHIFSGKLRCGHCGYALARRKQPTPRFYCDTSYRKVGNPCMDHYVDENQLAGIVYDAILQYCKTLLDKGFLAKRKKKSNRIAALKKQVSVYQTAVSRFENQKAELYEERAEGHITKEQYIKKYQVLRTEHEDMSCQLDELKVELTVLELAMAQTLPQERQLQNYLATESLTREMVVEFVDCIYVYDRENIHIKWRFEQEGTH